MEKYRRDDYGFGEYKGFPVYEMLGAGFRGQAGWVGIGGGSGPEIPAILVGDLLDYLYPGDEPLYSKATYQERVRAVEEWCRENNGTYYSRGRESFSLAEAYEQAIDEGAEVVVLEDLS